MFYVEQEPVRAGLGNPPGVEAGLLCSRVVGATPCHGLQNLVVIWPHHLCAFATSGETLMTAALGFARNFIKISIEKKSL